MKLFDLSSDIILFKPHSFLGIDVNDLIGDHCGSLSVMFAKVSHAFWPVVTRDNNLCCNFLWNRGPHFGKTSVHAKPNLLRTLQSRLLFRSQFCRWQMMNLRPSREFYPNLGKFVENNSPKILRRKNRHKNKQSETNIVLTF